MAVIPWRKSSMDKVGLRAVPGLIVEFLCADWITSSCKYVNILVLRETENKNGTAKKGISLNTNILTHLQLEVIQSAQRKSTIKPGTALSPTLSMELFLHGMTAMNYPPRHCLSTTSLWKMQNVLYPMHTFVGHNTYWSRFITQLQPSSITLNTVIDSTL